MRKLRTKRQIGLWITEELHKPPECVDARVSVQYELGEPGPGGCNWSDGVVVKCGVNDREDVTDRLRPILRRAQCSFNVSEPQP